LEHRSPAPVSWQGYAEAVYVKVVPTQQGLLTEVSVVRGDKIILRKSWARRVYGGFSDGPRDQRAALYTKVAGRQGFIFQGRAYKGIGLKGCNEKMNAIVV
jgi:hypothetical protein